MGSAGSCSTKTAAEEATCFAGALEVQPMDLQEPFKESGPLFDLHALANQA